ncbi:MAG TPA: molybdopterin-dependent oxidoreductase [Geminicoccaceae bacterium]|nr:molybdopterin-dependent oxidoreductase [Geminicoccaceae bacterium]
MKPSGAASGLIVHGHDPLNLEPSLDLLRRSFLTPNGAFFVRNHAPVPEVDVGAYRLEVRGAVARPLRLSLDGLRRGFAFQTVTATLQCAGNRRSGLAGVGPVQGVAWGEGAIGTAAWGGVPLREVLRAAGCRDDGTLHVAFAGLDEVEEAGRRFGFGGSIPLRKALCPEVLLAFEMNGGPLPPEHGAPLRVVVPGYIGARSVKWLHQISVQPEPSDNHFQARDYKLLPPGADAENVDWDAGVMLGELPVNAAICAPRDGATVDAGSLVVRGYAVAGGGREVVRVDVSTDGGAGWTVADLTEGGAGASPWAWVFWEARPRVRPGGGDDVRELVVRAWDSAAQTQPERPESVWSFRGYMNTSWHRVRVRLT